MDWSWVASCRNRGQPGLRFPKRKTRRPRLIWLRRRLDEKPTSERCPFPPIVNPERGEGVGSWGTEMLRCAQQDKLNTQRDKLSSRTPALGTREPDEGD